jgi:O-antigen/teichoic acid export membrane protein
VTTPRRLFSNTAVVVVGSALQRLLTFGTTMLLARGLGGEQFGVYAFVVAYMTIFSFLIDLGFERVIARELARQPARVGALIGTGFIIRGFLSVVAAVAAVTAAWLLRLPSLTWWCIFLAALGLPLAVESVVRAFFQSRFQMQYVYLLTLPGGVVFVLLAAATIWMGLGLAWVFVAALVTGVFSVSLMLWVALPRMEVVWRLDWGLVRYLWRESWELGAVILIWLVALRIDQLLLYWLRSPTDLGHYIVAVKIPEALNLIPESIMVTVFPLLAAADVSAPQRLDRVYRLTVRYLIVLVLPIALLVTLERGPLIRLLFGATYIPGSSALAILAWWMFFSYTGAVYVNLMIVRSQQRLIASVSALALVVNIVLNLLAIPRWGATGAAAANLVSSATSFALFSVLPQSRSLMRVCHGEAARPLAAMAASVACVGLLAPADLRAVLTPPLYAVLLAAFGGVGRQDWALVRKLLHPALRYP